ncbi:MAG: flagellar basal body protein, partial [Lachnospiraceae bacterium]|nr:flagellar basal body protein [Lachnospiraceae bacterium]
MSLMGALSVGKSGLSMSQYAINTTAHNLANVDTQGYVRQQVVFGTTQYQT